MAYNNKNYSKGNNQGKKKPELMEAHAPYNFVSLDNKVFYRYESFEELPSHGEYKKNLLNGYISFEVKTETPLMICGTDSNSKEKVKNFIKDNNGDYIIPGSTLKGLIRNNMTILGLSSARDYIEENRFLYRTFADKSKKLREEYDNRIGLKAGKNEQGKTFSRVENVKAGYIYKFAKDDYRIIPAKEIKGKSYFTVSEKNLKEKWPYLKGVNFMYEKREKYKPYQTMVKYTINEERLVVKDLNNCKENDRFGYLTCAGFMNNKKSHYLVTEINNNEEEIVISKEEARAYEKDYTINKKAEFYKLPEKVGKNYARPIFYAKYNGNVYFGYTPYLRIFYDYSTIEGLEEEHKKESDLSKIDYVKAIMGFTNKVDNNYKGRVDFEDAKINVFKGIDGPYEIVLEQPKASCFPNYLEQPNGIDKTKLISYNDEDFKIRGIKNYWLKEKVNPEKAKSNVSVIINPLKEGASFEGKVHFSNLSEDELGLLLWSIKLNEGCQQNIGLAKPYGFGRISIRNLKLYIEDLDRKYSSFTNDFYVEYKAEEYINKYKSFMQENDINIDNKYSIKEFMLIKSQVVDGNLEKYKYMVFNHPEYKNEFAHRAVLPSIEKILTGRDSSIKLTNNSNNTKIQVQSSSNNKEKDKVKVAIALKCNKCGETFYLNENQKKALDSRGLPYPKQCFKCKK